MDHLPVHVQVDTEVKSIIAGLLGLVEINNLKRRKISRIFPAQKNLKKHL